MRAEPAARRAAFFDVDNTLIDLKSMFAFQSWYWRQRPEPGRTPAESDRRFIDRLERHPQRADRRAVNRAFYESFAGREQSDVQRLCREWFDALLAERGERLFIAPALALADRLRRDGFLLVAVSGSSQDILAPLIAHLRFDACLATRLETQAGRFTGRIVPPQMIGEGKAEAIGGFLRRHGLFAADCVACGDHASDAPMLRAVGRGHVLPGDAELEALARVHGWHVLPAAPVHSTSLRGDLTGVHFHA